MKPYLINFGSNFLNCIQAHALALHENVHYQVWQLFFFIKTIESKNTCPWSIFLPLLRIPVHFSNLNTKLISLLQSASYLKNLLNHPRKLIYFLSHYMRTENKLNGISTYYGLRIWGQSLKIWWLGLTESSTENVWKQIIEDRISKN